ncbi:transcriptional regulator [Gluconobacter japonicus]|uniref:LysR family transcriptional regulator n=1 Tax=Gluconobacter japonicus TaxID=376620 RepID=UPI0007814F3A|nr:LysR family transcriptional regulator [Gluconobacter japonicus]KXV40192.1 transcriptional regulator [Gluconobacter japonicus]
MKPDFHELGIFIDVARHRSFRKAAELRNVSPSALSHAIRGLEDKLGLRLLNRTTRSVMTTEAGEQLLQAVRPAFHDIDRALQDLRILQDTPTGTLRINAPRPAARLLAMHFAEFTLRYPRISLEIVTEERLIDIVAEGFDAGIRFGDSVAADMIALPVGPPQPFVVVASPAYLARKGTPVSPRDLKDHLCIGRRFPSGRCYAWEFEEKGTPFSIRVPSSLMVDDDDLMLAAAIQGAGCAYVYDALAQPAMMQDKLRPILRDWLPSAEPFFLYYPGRRQMPKALRAFIDVLKNPSLPTTP